MSDSTPEVLSCIQPTADLHIGNYFGAVANWVQLQDQYECVYGIVDLHAITVPYDPDKLRQNVNRMVIDLLACGIDPERSTPFIQSLIPEHTELYWILSCLCSYGELSRMTQFKDKTAQLESKAADAFVSSGLFNYPVLQAADILAYRAKYVPVGQDQEQHLELTRSIARRFNQRYGEEYFPEPKPLFTNTPKIMSLADPTSKMSKSAGEKHYIGLFEDEAGIRRKVKSAVTDSGQPLPDGGLSPGVANMLEILRACRKLSTAEQMEKEYHEAKLRYVDLKGATADALVELTSGLREKRDEIKKNKDKVKRLIQETSARARTISIETMRGVRKLAGLPQLKYAK